MNCHYVKVKINSPNNVVCCKSSGEPVTQTDIILNGMWRYFMEDWSYIMNNPGFKLFAKQYKGCILGIYYLPNHNPLGTEYDFPTKRCYIINQCYDTYNQAELSLGMVFRYLNKCMGVGVTDIDGNYMIRPINELKFNSQKLSELCSSLDSKQLTDSDILDAIDLSDTSVIFAKDKKKLSLVLKRQNQCYQIMPDDATDSCLTTDYKERASYEFVLCDFIKFFNERNMIKKLRGSYRNIVCYLFNEYIIEWEKPTGYVMHNITPESITPPHVGYDHKDSIIPTYVPNTLTLKLCNEHILYRNIFKLLLANLKVMKSPKYCVYMNNEQIGTLNTIVQAISIIQTDSTPLTSKKKRNTKSL